MTNVHKGMATWGERLVPLEDFRAATTRFGRTLSEEDRRSAVEEYLTLADDATPVEGPYGRIAVFGAGEELVAHLTHIGRDEAQVDFAIIDLRGEPIFGFEKFPIDFGLRTQDERVDGEEA